MLLFVVGCAWITPSDLGARCDLDGDGAAREGCVVTAVYDCDDGDSDVQERTYYADADGDGQGGATSVQGCEAPAGFVEAQGDCDDTDPAVTMLSWYPDMDDDGYGVTAEAVASCPGIYQYVQVGGDCDDTRDDLHPGARDYCGDGLDNDCDGTIDNLAWYADVDGDSYGDPASVVQACDPPEGYVSQAGDCDDTDAGANPAAPEVCDDADRDEDCNGYADDDDPAVTGRPDWCRDTDGDGYGAGDGTTQCDAPAGMVPCGDCDEADPGVNPATVETYYDGVDADCDGWDDDDADHDGYASSVDGAAAGDDCDDADAGFHPGAEDTPDDGLDQDCNGGDFLLAACVESVANETLLAYTYTPASLSGSFGSDCWAGVSYTIYDMLFSVTESSVALGEPDQWGSYALSGPFTALINSDADPFSIDVEVLCVASTCDGYINPVSGELTGSLTVLGVSTSADETIVDVDVTPPSVTLTAEEDAVHTHCGGTLTDLLAAMGTTPAEVLATSVSSSQDSVEMDYASVLEAEIEARCRD